MTKQEVFYFRHYLKKNKKKKGWEGFSDTFVEHPATANVSASWAASVLDVTPTNAEVNKLKK